MRSFDFGYRPGRPGMPLVAVIPGFGRPYHEGTSLYLSHVLQLHGFHVVVLHSPSHRDFLLESHHHGIPGVTTEDARDVLSGISAIREDLRRRGARFTQLHLLGYSMGALNAAFARLLDQQMENVIDRLVLVNPPIDMEHGMRRLDSFLAFTKLSLQEKANLALKILPPIAVRNLLSTRSGKKSEAFLREAVLSEHDLSVLVGLTFQQTIQGGVRAARKTAGLSEVKTIQTFTDFCETVTVPHYRRWNPGSTSRDLFQNESLPRIGRRLAKDEDVFVMHNRDDFLLGQNDMFWMQSTFGERAVVFQHGGHLGNLWRADFQTTLLGFLGIQTDRNAIIKPHASRFL